MVYGIDAALAGAHLVDEAGAFLKQRALGLAHPTLLATASDAAGRRFVAGAVAETAFDVSRQVSHQHPPLCLV